MIWLLLRKIMNCLVPGIVFLLVLPEIARCKEIDYGLHIKSYPEIDSRKTSLVLNDGQQMELDREFTLSFDLFVRGENAFGIVFRLITNKNENIDLMFAVGEGNKRYPILIINQSVHPIPSEISLESWVSVSLRLSKITNQVSLAFGSGEVSVPFDLSGSDGAKISFGLCPFDSFKMLDIASVNIKNIKLLKNGALTHYWKLREHNGNQTLDSLNYAVASATNPVWMLDMSATWEKVYTKKVQNNSLFAFDGVNQFYIVQPDTNKIVVFDPIMGVEREIVVESGRAASNATNQIYYDSTRDELVSYNIDEDRFSTFSFRTRSWSDALKGIKDPGYLNNSSIFSVPDSALFSFGGYGFYSYNNSLIKMSPNGRKTETVELDPIPPRYFSATAMSDSVLYIFGGRGNPSGRQELFPRNYYDLYSITIPGYHVTKLWEVPDVDVDFLPGENMVLDTVNSAFYLFVTQVNGGQLLRVRPEKRGFDTVSFPIEENLEGLYLYTNLYYSAEENELYALICKKKNQSETEVSIYAMNFPPISLNSIHQRMDGHRGSKLMAILFTVFAIMTIVLGVSFLAFRRQRVVRLYKLAPSDSSVDTQEEIFSDSGEEATGRHDEYPDRMFVDTRQDFSRNGVSFLGGFSVTDREANDISGNFTPTLKYLLILLILHSKKGGKGLAGRKMINLLWPDKAEESAKNNRNVYLSKLRAIAEQLDGFELGGSNETWFANLDGVACDYTETLDLFDQLKACQFSDKAAVYRVLSLLQRGELLPAVETEWIDSFKSEFSNTTVVFLIKLLRSAPYIGDDGIRLAVADILFIHDPINEEALHLKCSILFKSGRKGIAKNVYDNYCRDYQQLLGIEFGHSFSEMVD